MKTTTVKLFEQTIKFDQKHEYIWLKPVCDFFEINHQNQTRSIKSDASFKSKWIKKSSHFLYKDNRQRLLLNKKGLILWLWKINPNTIKPSLQPKFLKYRELIFDYLYESATNPETTYTQPQNRIELIKRKANIHLKIQELDKDLFENYPKFNKLIKLKEELKSINKSLNSMDKEVFNNQLQIEFTQEQNQYIEN